MAERSDPTVMFSDLSQVNEYGVPPENEEDDYPDEVIPVISCCILVLFVIMIILLLLVSSYYVNEYVEDTNTPKVTYKAATRGEGTSSNSTSTNSTTATGPGPSQRSTPRTTMPPVVVNRSTSSSLITRFNVTNTASIGPGNLTMQPPASSPSARPSSVPTPPTPSRPSSALPPTRGTASQATIAPTAPPRSATSAPRTVPSNASTTGPLRTTRPSTTTAGRATPSTRTRPTPTRAPNSTAPMPRRTTTMTMTPTTITTRATSARRPTNGTTTTTTRAMTIATTTRKPTIGTTTTMTRATTTRRATSRTTTSTAATTRRPTSPTTTTTTRATTTRMPPNRTIPSTTTMTTTSGPTHRTPRPGKPMRNFTLICVFEYITRQRWPKADQCTDYVYIAVFTYFDDTKVNNAPLTFTRKTLKPGPFNRYFDTDSTYWTYLYQSDSAVRIAMTHSSAFPHADWYIGMWGSTFLRLLASFWEVERIRDSLHDYLRQPYLGAINTSAFDGFAIINTIIRDQRADHQVSLTVNRSIFRGPRNPIIRPSWSYLHTAAVWPGGNDIIPEKHVKNFFGVADFVGLSTSNTTDEPNLVQQAIDSPGFYWASPPNPIRPPLPGLRGMLDALQDFPHWKTVLNRSEICFSVSSSINYVQNEGTPIDFKTEIVRQTDKVQRYTRLRFTTRINGTYPVVDNGFKYEFDNTTYTHYWKGVSRGRMTAFFAYDDASTLRYKMQKLLDAYPDDKCVVFDDLGDDFHEAAFTYDNHRVEFKKYELLNVVASAMVQRYGPAFPPQYY